jgi:hypothetical protein
MTGRIVDRGTLADDGANRELTRADVMPDSSAASSDPDIEAPDRRPAASESAAMPDTEIAPESTPERPAETVSGRRSRRLGRGVVDALVVIAYVLLGWRVLAGFPLGQHRLPPGNSSDQLDLEWFLANGLHLVSHPQNPFFTRQMGAPLGVNLLDNTSMLGISVPFAPLTAAAGAYTSYVVMTMLGLAGTATAWYWVLSRKLVRSRLGAALGGAVVGFGPGMIAHVAGQADLVINLLIPFILWLTFDVATGRRRWWRAIALGVLIAYQMFLNQETLLVTAVGAAVAAIVLAATSHEARDRARPFLSNLAVAGGVAFVLLAYPLWFEFFGPQHVSGLVPTAVHTGTTLPGLWHLPRTSWGASIGLTGAGGIGNEQNVALGPALVLLGCIAVWLRRNRIVLASAVAGLVLLVLSLGSRVDIGGSHLVGPYRLLSSLPIFASLTPARLGLALLPVAAVLIAVAFDRLSLARGPWRWPHVLGRIVVAAALLPLFPTPVPTEPGPVVPAFITSGTWRQYVNETQSVVAFPVTVRRAPTLISWSTATADNLRIANGYFVGPAAPGSTASSLSPQTRPTMTMINSIATTRRVPRFTSAQREAVVDDLQYWRAALVVVPSGSHVGLFKAAATELFGPGRFVEGAWIWDVRRLTGRNGNL